MEAGAAGAGAGATPSSKKSSKREVGTATLLAAKEARSKQDVAAFERYVTSKYLSDKTLPNTGAGSGRIVRVAPPPKPICPSRLCRASSGDAGLT